MSKLQVGFARMDITPPLGIDLSGYFFDRKAQGVLDPLYADALAVCDGERTAVVMTCDLLGIYADAARTWPREIARMLGLHEDSVFICHTHTHTGPEVLDERNVHPNDPEYDAWLFRRLHDTALGAVRDLKPVLSVRGTQGESKGIAFVRRFQMKDGRFQTWGRYGDPDIVAYASVPDESVRLVRIAREGGAELALVNFQLHPDNMSGDWISADYPGVLREEVERAKPGVKCLFFTGAEGQIGSVDWWHATDGHQKGKQNAVRIGKKLADDVLAMFDDVTELGGDAVRFGQTRQECKTKWSAEKREELMAESQRLIHIHEHGNEEEELGPDWIATPLIAEAYTLCRLDKEQCDRVLMTVSAVTVGGLAFLGIPGEPFCEIGRHIRDNSPYPVTFVCCQTNGCEGYYPTAEAYEQGGYEPRNTAYPKGIGEILMDMGDELLKNL